MRKLLFGFALMMSFVSTAAELAADPKAVIKSIYKEAFAEPVPQLTSYWAWRDIERAAQASPDKPYLISFKPTLKLLWNRGLIVWPIEGALSLVVIEAYKVFVGKKEIGK
jgi:hypothetical protein